MRFFLTVDQDPDQGLGQDRLRFEEAGDAAAIEGSEGDVLPLSAIRDIDPMATPPEVHTVSGQTCFVSGEARDALEEFATEQGIPVRRRPDVWGDLLAPFVDAEPDPEEEAEALARLEAAGLGPDEVAAIRTEVGPLMLAYNERYLDWFHLGLADLLDAVSADWIPAEHRPAPADFPRFTAWAMAIAESAGSD